MYESISNDNTQLYLSVYHPTSTNEFTLVNSKPISKSIQATTWNENWSRGYDITTLNNGHVVVVFDIDLHLAYSETYRTNWNIYYSIYDKDGYGIVIDILAGVKRVTKIISFIYFAYTN